MLAPEDVTIYTYPAIPNYEQQQNVSLFIIIFKKILTYINSASGNADFTMHPVYSLSNDQQ